MSNRAESGREERGVICRRKANGDVQRQVEAMAGEECRAAGDVGEMRR